MATYIPQTFKTAAAMKKLLQNTNERIFILLLFERGKKGLSLLKSRKRRIYELFRKVVNAYGTSSEFTLLFT